MSKKKQKKQRPRSAPHPTNVRAAAVVPGTWAVAALIPPPEQDPAGLFNLLAVADAATGFLLGLVPVVAPLDGADVADELRAIIRDAVTPPTALQVATERMANWLAPIAADIGVAVVQVAKLGCLQDLQATLRRKPLQLSTGTLTGTRHRETELCLAAADFAAAAPWRHLANADVFEILSPRVRLPIVCVMGNGGEIFGIALYDSFETFVRMFHFDPGSAPATTRDLDSVTLTFEPLADYPDYVRLSVARRGLGSPPDWLATFQRYKSNRGGEITSLSDANMMLTAIEATTAMFRLHEATFERAFPPLEATVPVSDGRTARIRTRADLSAQLMDEDDDDDVSTIRLADLALHHLVDFDHLTAVAPLPPGFVSAIPGAAWAGGPNGAGAVGADPLIAVFARCTKQDALAAARRMPGFDRVTLERKPGESLLLAWQGDRPVGLLAIFDDIVADAFERRRHQTRDPTAVVFLMTGGGVKRAMRSCTAADIVFARFVRLHSPPG